MITFCNTFCICEAVLDNEVILIANCVLGNLRNSNNNNNNFYTINHILIQKCRYGGEMFFQRALVDRFKPNNYKCN